MARRRTPQGCELCESPTPCEPCDKCNHVVHMGDWPFCEKSGGHSAASRRRRAQVEPCVVYKGPNGEIGFVASSDPNCLSAKNYEKQGYNRVEMQMFEARKFARQMNKEERKRAELVLQAVYESEEELKKSERAELRAAMAHWSPLARDFAIHAMEANDRKDAEYYRAKDPGFYIEGFDA